MERPVKSFVEDKQDSPQELIQRLSEVDGIDAAEVPSDIQSREDVVEWYIDRLREADDAVDLWRSTVGPIFFPLEPFLRGAEDPKGPAVYGRTPIFLPEERKRIIKAIREATSFR